LCHSSRSGLPSAQSFMEETHPQPNAQAVASRQVGDPEVHDEDLLAQLKKSPDSNEASNPEMAVMFALHVLLKAGFELAQAHDATPDRPYFLPDGLLGGPQFWTSLMAPTKARNEKVNLEKLEKLKLMRLPRSITDELDPDALFFQDATLQAWFGIHDYILPLSPRKGKETPAAYYERILVDEIKTTGKRRLNEEQTEDLLRQAAFCFLKPAQLLSIPCAPKQYLITFLEDLMGQSNFQNAMQVVHKDDTSLSPICPFLEHGGEEPAYQMISDANLKIDKTVVFCALDSHRPEVLRKVLELAHYPKEKKHDTIPKLRQYIYQDLQANAKSGKITQGIVAMFVKVLDDFLPKGKQK